MQTLPRSVQEKVTEYLDSCDHSFYLYDLDSLDQHIAALTTAVEHLWYAVKANPASAVLQTLAAYDTGFDVASPGELQQVLNQNISPGQVLNTGPAKSFSQLEAFVNSGVRIFVLESIQQVTDLQHIAQRYAIYPRVLLRVQLDWHGFSYNNILGGSDITPFGLEAQAWQALLGKDTGNLDICGFHVFQWGNILDPEMLASIWQTSFEQLEVLARKLDMNMDIVDVGGGLGIPYHAGDTAISYEALGNLLQRFQRRYTSCNIWLELGRYAVGEYGYYFTRVVDRKVVGQRELLILAGGLNHLSRPALLGQAHPVSLFRHSRAACTDFQLHGPLCTALDNLGSVSLPDDVQPGDWLCFAQCGAYGFTESMPYFLCHDMPAELLLQHGRLQTLRAPLSPSGWLA